MDFVGVGLLAPRHRGEDDDGVAAAAASGAGRGGQRR